jgi:hypothetical protein
MYQEWHPYATLITFAALGMFRLWVHVLAKLTEITISHLRDFGKTPTKKYPWMACPALEHSLIIRVRSSDYDRKSHLIWFTSLHSLSLYPFPPKCLASGPTGLW